MMEGQKIFLATTIVASIIFLIAYHQYAIWGRWFNPLDIAHHEVVILIIFAIAITVLIMVMVKRKR